MQAKRNFEGIGTSAKNKSDFQKAVEGTDRALQNLQNFWDYLIYSSARDMSDVAALEDSRKPEIALYHLHTLIKSD